MDCEGSRGFAICLLACDLIRKQGKIFGVTLGAGAMGDVYRARDGRHDRVVGT
jgi:hypothetical protein